MPGVEKDSDTCDWKLSQGVGALMPNLDGKTRTEKVDR